MRLLPNREGEVRTLEKKTSKPNHAREILGMVMLGFGAGIAFPILLNPTYPPILQWLWRGFGFALFVTGIMVLPPFRREVIEYD
jgi:hypothetical protein